MKNGQQEKPRSIDYLLATLLSVIAPALPKTGGGLVVSNADLSEVKLNGGPRAGHRQKPQAPIRQPKPRRSSAPVVR